MFEGSPPPRQVSCDTHALDLPPIRWPKLVESVTVNGHEHTLRPINWSDIEVVANFYRKNYPELYNSSRHFLMEPSFYEEHVAMLDAWERHHAERRYFIGLLERADTGALMVTFGFLRDAHDRTAQGLALVVEDEFRGQGFTRILFSYADRLLAASGVDYAFGHAQAMDDRGQRSALRGGWQVGGIMPGAKRVACDNGRYYRDLLVYMYKFYNGAERYTTRAEDWTLAPNLLSAHDKLQGQD